SEVSLTGLGLGQVDAANGHRAFTVATTTDARNVQQTWGVDVGTGAISLMGTYFYGSTAKGVATSPVRVEPLDAADLTPPSFYVHAVRFQGTVHLFTTYLDGTGDPHPSGPGLDLGQDLTNLRLRDFGTSGLLVVGRDGNGVSTMFVVETRRSAEQTVVPYAISYHTSLAGTDFELCREATAHAEGDFLLARQAATTHALQLSAYRIGDRPY
ncbi:MAG TPA: hypothetical protein VEM95_00725, partial [Thermoplasmata archaeon]|nr:hypothetical protein [Thermoplasmata archaeon]